jgi:Zn-dependent protease with chaperone function
LGKVGSSFGFGVISFLGAMIAGSYANAKWLRQQETDCDLSVIKFLDGESMVSALIKFNELHPKRFESRLVPKHYPTL